MFTTKPIVRVLAVTLTLGLIVGCVPPPPSAPEPTLSPLAMPAGKMTPSAPSSTLDVSPVPLLETTATRAPREPGMGSLTGKLERFDGTPMRGILVYAALIEDRNGVKLATVDPLLDVRAITDAEGRFWFDNLAPGEYALAMQSPVGIIMPHNTKGTIVRFHVEANTETVLGRLAVGYTYPNND